MAKELYTKCQTSLRVPLDLHISEGLGLQSRLRKVAQDPSV